MRYPAWTNIVDFIGQRRTRLSEMLDEQYRFERETSSVARALQEYKMFMHEVDADEKIRVLQWIASGHTPAPKYKQVVTWLLDRDLVVDSTRKGLIPTPSGNDMLRFLYCPDLP